VEDVVVGASPGWLRAYRDPVVVGTEVVDAVAPSSSRALAQQAAATASSALAPIVARYVADGGPASVALWMVERPGLVRTVTGRGMPAAVRDAADGDAHRLAWADDRGDVVVDLVAYGDATASQRASAIRHAVAHVATQRATVTAPAILGEGIALAEERRAGSAVVLAATELEALDEAFSTRTSGIADLLVADPAARLDGESDHLAAAATVAWLLEERGAARTRALFAALDEGVAPATALRRTIGLAPRGVELEVAAWTRARLAAATAPDRTTDEAEAPDT
jgi:hypothetical protein